MVEYACPGCGERMRRIRRGDARFWTCPSCDAHALSVGALRRMLVKESWAESWKRIRGASSPGARKCPGCARTMAVTAPVAGGVRLDFCDPCDFLYLDPQELAALPKVPVVEAPRLPPEVARAFAMAEVELIRAESDARLERLFGPLREVALGILGGVAAAAARR